MNSVQVYIGLFRNKACNMHINEGGREAGQQWCQTVGTWSCFQCRMLGHLLNENLDYEQTWTNLSDCTHVQFLVIQILDEKYEFSDKFSLREIKGI